MPDKQDNPPPYEEMFPQSTHNQIKTLDSYLVITSFSKTMNQMGRKNRKMRTKPVA